MDRTSGLRAAAVALLLSLGVTGCGDDPEGEDNPGEGQSGASDPPGDGASDAGAPADGPRVELATGVVQGEQLEGAVRFLAIPYARPPVAELRFAAPQPAEPWEGVRAETDFVPGCPQQEDQGAPASDNEDCLYLNVWTPDPMPDGAPVMVWIHGGGNFSGATGIPVPTTDTLWYDGRIFAERQGVVLVTIQYRLGPLGFNPHPSLADEGAPLGNQGLHDQRLALEWVRDNITSFGGDAGNVTIFGESAGSANVCYHVASPGSRGLFHRAIGQSGGCTIRSVGPEQRADAVGDRMVAYGEAVGCPAGDDQLACMREVPVTTILEHAMQPMPGGGETSEDSFRFAAVVDGEGGFLPDDLRTLFDAGEIADVPYLLGANHDEGTTLVWRASPITTEEEYLADLEVRYGDAAGEIAELYPASEFGGDYNAARARVVGDSGLVCGTHDTARRFAAAGRAVFMYNFNVHWSIAPELFLAGHAAEISHVFGTPHLPEPDAESAAVADAMNTYWARFAATGDPNGSDAPAEWPSFAMDGDRRLQLAPEWQVLEDFRAEECAFWRRYHGVE
ncbi:MAG: carboxylesterase family protein [Myxococcales bacterium]|nr:carboxylesterase family protein [Myxococcales bacterium]